MGLLYHYTSFKTLFEIVKPDRINWLARYYKYFSKKDYEWNFKFDTMISWRCEW